MKKIAILTPDLYSGGAERAAGLLSVYLSRQYEVYLLLSDDSNMVYEHKGTILFCGKHGLEYYEYYVEKYKRKFQFDCSISFMEPFNFTNIRTRRKNEKVIISERNVQSKFIPKRVYEDYFVQQLYPYADEIVSVSDGVRDDLASEFKIEKEKITTIYNFAEKENTRKKAEKEALGEEWKGLTEFLDGDPYFVNIGRLAPQKNQKKLLVQFAKLVEKKKNIKLLIIGSGELRDELEGLIEKLHLKKYVKIISRTKNPFAYLKNALAFVLSSDYEGLPNVLIESMVCAVPVISVDCKAGPRELIADIKDYDRRITENQYTERGILVYEALSDLDGTSSYLSDAMKYMLENSEYREKVVIGMKRFIENYDNEALFNKWIWIIEKKPERMIAYEYGRYPSDHVSVYGAGKIGKLLVHQLLGQGIKVDVIIVSRKEDNPKCIEGIPVVLLEDIRNKEKVDLILGVTGPSKNEIMDDIRNIGFRSISLPYLYLE